MSKETYQTRDATLAVMGYASYADYLASDLWGSVKRRAWAAHGRACRLCKYKATELHHTDYTRQTLTGKDLSGLVPVCRRCYESLEFTPAGEKRTFRQVKAEFRLRCTALGIQIPPRTKTWFKPVRSGTAEAENPPPPVKPPRDKSTRALLRLARKGLVDVRSVPARCSRCGCSVPKTVERCARCLAGKPVRPSSRWVEDNLLRYGVLIRVPKPSGVSNPSIGRFYADRQGKRRTG